MLPICLIICIPIALLLDILMGVFFTQNIAPSLRILLIMVGAFVFLIGSMAALGYLTKYKVNYSPIRYDKSDAVYSGPLGDLRLSETREFSLGLIGHIFMMGLVSTLICAMLHTHHLGLFYHFILIASICIILGNLIYSSRLSPWYRGPTLVVTPEGIRSLRFFIPWSAVKGFTAQSDRNWGISVYTLQNRAQYSIKQEKDLFTPSQIHISGFFGVTPEKLVYYLEMRAKLEQELKDHSD